MKTSILCMLVFCCTSVFAQAFVEAIQKFQKQDSISPPKQGEILLLGSSSFTMWTDVQVYFSDKHIINRGFGGSTLEDQIRYVDFFLSQYMPRQIVIYCGENDIAIDSLVDGTAVFNRFISLFKMIRSKLPQCHISYISMKPSPSRFHLQDKYKKGNELIKDFIGDQQRASYIDIYCAMLQGDRPDASLFLEDMLHMNKKGYAIWQKKMKAHLK